MRIFSDLKQKLLNIHGERARDWLDSLPALIASYSEKWDLKDLTLHPHSTYNIIYFATSPKHYDVVLKLGLPGPELLAEVNFLKIYNGSDVSKIYEHDERSGAMLLERILPGKDLKRITDAQERIITASELINMIPKDLKGITGFPHYSDWLNRAFTKARREDSSNIKLMEFIDQAESAYGEILSLDLPEYLLHGDIHHTNILLGTNEQWKVIDPKGVIGIKAFETARFIENETEIYDTDLEEIIEVFSQTMQIDGELIAKCLFVDKVLSKCWDLEEGSCN